MTLSEVADMIQDYGCQIQCLLKDHRDLIPDEYFHACFDASCVIIDKIDDLI